MAWYAAKIDAGKNGTRALVAAPGAGRRIRLLALWGCGSAADGTLVVQDGAGTPVALTGTITVDIDVDPNVNLAPIGGGGHWGECTANTALNIVLSANMDFDGVVSYEVF